MGCIIMIFPELGQPGFKVGTCLTLAKIGNKPGLLYFE
jgi:hypothetical protein